MPEHNQDYEKSEAAFIKFSLDSEGEIYCGCKFDQDICDIDKFAEMFSQIFSGELSNAACLFITEQLIKEDKEDTAKNLISALKEKVEKRILDSFATEVVIKPTDLAQKINTTSNQG